MNKMYVEVFQDNELKNTWNNQQDITMQLLGYFFKHKKTPKTNNFTIKIKDNGENATIIIKTWFYDCENKQQITTMKFYNVPMHYGWLDTYKINKLIEKEIKKEV